MRISRLSAGSMCLAVVVLSSTPLLAEKAHEMRFLIGMKSSPATQILRDRGFESKDSKTEARVRHTYWWDDKGDDCLHVRSRYGVVIGVDDASKGDCKHGGGKTATVVGAVAGAAIIAALLAKKKKDKDHVEKYTTQEERDLYDSGFYDGAQSNAYHNPRNSSAYSDGYAEGAKQSESTPSFAKFSDLNGARAAGGMEELERRGFTQVDNFTSGNTRYSIQWREPSRQCVQVTIADGHFADVRDIRTHPKCR